MYPLITLETYAPMYTVDGYENSFYDEELTEFTVPYAWLLNEFNADNFGCEDLTGFLLNTYDWDDTYFLYERARADKVIVRERIVKR